MSSQIHKTQCASGPKVGGPGVFSSLARASRFVLITTAWGVAVAAATLWAWERFHCYQRVSHIRRHLPAGLTGSSDTDSPTAAASPKAQTVRQIEAWDRQRQEAEERAHAARIAYAMLRNSGAVQESPECDAQVRRAEAAESAVKMFSRQIELACDTTGGRNLPIHSTGNPAQPHAPAPASHPNPDALISDGAWHDGNDQFMAYQPVDRATR